MVLWCAIILLVFYCWSFVRGARRGFAIASNNVLVVVAGLLLLAPATALALWYYMIKEWPMNVGGKPNWTWYSNEPTVIGGLESVAYGGIVLMILVLGSLLYATARMLMVRRGRRAA